MENKKLLRIFRYLLGLVTLVVILTFALPLIFAEIFMGLAAAGSGLFMVILVAFYAASYVEIANTIFFQRHESQENILPMKNCTIPVISGSANPVLR